MLSLQRVLGIQALLRDVQVREEHAGEGHRCHHAACSTGNGEHITIQAQELKRSADHWINDKLAEHRP